MMTKKQLLKALSLIDDDAVVVATFEGKYSTKYKASLYGVNILLDDDKLKASLLVHEDLDEEKAA